MGGESTTHSKSIWFQIFFSFHNCSVNMDYSSKVVVMSLSFYCHREDGKEKFLKPSCSGSPQVFRFNKDISYFSFNSTFFPCETDKISTMRIWWCKCTGRQHILQSPMLYVHWPFLWCSLWHILSSGPTVGFSTPAPLLWVPQDVFASANTLA